LAYLSIKDGNIESKRPDSFGRKLTPKMKSFVNAYMGPANFNALKAIELSDYNCKTKYSKHQTAAELMNHPLVRAEIDRREMKRQEKSEVTAEYLINKLIEIIDATDEEKTGDRLRAIELAGKAIALWKERQELTGADGEAIRVEQERKESVADFTSRISRLAQRDGTDNVVGFPDRGREG
jgi:phage terminase small subunit